MELDYIKISLKFTLKIKYALCSYNEYKVNWIYLLQYNGERMNNQSKMINSIKILGAHGGKGFGLGTTCLQINQNTVIDAGNIIKPLSHNAIDIDNIFITHSHLDHISDIPFLIDAFFEQREKPITIYALKATIENLNKHIFNSDVWPDFFEINLIKNQENTINFIELEIGKIVTLTDGTKIKPILNNHTTSSCGFVISKNNNATLFTSDTYKCPSIWEEINSDKTIQSVIVDVSFPSKLEKLALASKHFTPALLKEELSLLKRKDVRVYINHVKPAYKDDIEKEVRDLSLLLNEGKILDDNDVISLSNEYKAYTKKTAFTQQKEIDDLVEIGSSLTSEKNFDVLMEKIMLGAKRFTDADGGTLYLLTEDEKQLKFTVVQTDSLEIKMGGTQGEITWPALNLHKEDGSLNNEMVAAVCALEGKLINIPDVYEAEGFNFEGTKKFDESTGYRTKSMLVIPMKDHEGDVIGVLQLLNKQDNFGNTISFTQEDKKLIQSMSSQAAVAITNNRLIAGLENLLDAFIKSIATAIGEKSLYTGGHINRVAEVAAMITKAINEDNGVYKDTHYSPDEVTMLSRAAWLHDIGKIVIPEYVVDKATKLETIYDRINTVKTKFELVKRDLEIEYLKAKAVVTGENDIQKLQELFVSKQEKLQDDLNFVIGCNTGGEFMEDEKINRIEEIAKTQLIINNEKVNLLSENEVYNLSIRKGTLTQEERTVINNHVTVSFNMLNALPFPKKLKRVPVVAASHHKKVKGGGYGAPELMDLPMTLEDKILAVADVFEALTANDRPYKKANSLNTSLRILSFMVKDGDLDKDLVKFFVDKELHLEYADRHLAEEQKDEITVDFNNL